ncbi:glycosyltransferase family 87 protein [Halovenus marina]|uniref:glycosyltransferase family 87 protein n=1 Tax=Halovenus marina TaxID=3396621 RepID=UPI003F55F930
MGLQLRDRLGRHPPERFVLAFGLLVGFGTIIALVLWYPEGHEIDFHAYYFTGRKIIAGEPFVGWAITEGTFLVEKGYVYAPITAPLFVPYGLFGDWRIPFVIHTAILLGVFYLIGHISVRYIESQGHEVARVDRWLIIGFCLFSGPSVLGLYRGNVDPAVVLLIAVGFLTVERSRELTGGALWAIASLFKFFPAFLGVWLLYRRQYRAVASALVVGGGAMVLSVLVFGLDTNIDFVEFILSDRSREGEFVGGLNPELQYITVRRPLSQILPLTGNQLSVVSVILLSPVVLYLYQNVQSELDRLIAFFGTLVVFLITVIPLTAGYVVYLLFPLVSLVYLVDHRRTKACFLAALVLIHVPIYPQHVEAGFETLGIASGAGAVVLDLIRGGMAFTSVPLWAFLFVLAGCVLYVRSDVEPDTDADEQIAERSLF